jgi:hypothetical protein
MKVLMPLVLLVVGLAGCGGPAASPSRPTASTTTAATAASPTAAQPTAVPASPAQSAVTSADIDAMARRVFPGEHPAGCGDMATCPITDRLRVRLAELSRTPRDGPGPVAQFCRCQNGASGMSVTSEVTGSGGVAHVVLLYGPSFASKLDLIFLRQPDSRLLLDDTQCTGRGPATSLFAPTLAACLA